MSVHRCTLLMKDANANLVATSRHPRGRRIQRETAFLLNSFSMSNFGLFVRLIELHEYRRSTRTD
jgi:hypothetical protein